MAFFTKRYHPVGTPPGTLSRLPPSSPEPLRIRLVDFDKDNVTVLDDVAATECRPYLDRDTITWIHVQGHPDEALLRELGASFGLHALALEDVLNSGQRPKLEEFEKQYFVILGLPHLDKHLATTAQVSIFFTGSYLISFCEKQIGRFDPVVERLRQAESRLRSRGVDFLLYSLVDIVIDQGFPVLEEFGRQLDDLEIEILERADKRTLEKIHNTKRELIMLRNTLWPQREVINRILHDDNQIIDHTTRLYFRDCYDHSVQIIELLETYREMASSMLEIHLSSVSNRMNETMRVLTVIATIFIPLTFIVGVYGMNFDRTAGPLSMPELSWPLGYVGVWLIMIAIAGLMIAYFRRKGWF